MKTLYAIFGLKREAILLDSRLFILKAMVAIALGAILGHFFSITRLDMVSVLLGVMYNLEAINVSGLRGGINQLLASALGALTTGFLVYLTGYQVNFLVIALGIGFTLYIALKIDYRMVSPVAIFTSVYMTQLLQKDVLGNPSILLTFQVRIIALGLGIAIALACNFLFSIMYYRQLGKRRLEFVRIQGVLGLKKTAEVLAAEHTNDHSYQPVLASVFNDIEMVKANLESMMKESKIPFNKTEKKNLTHYYAMIIQIKTMIHLAYDSLYLKEEGQFTVDSTLVSELNAVIAGLQEIDFTDLKKIPPEIVVALDQQNVPLNQRRIADNLNRMGQHYHNLIDQLGLLQ